MGQPAVSRQSHNADALLDDYILAERAGGLLVANLQDNQQNRSVRAEEFRPCSFPLAQTMVFGFRLVLSLE